MRERKASYRPPKVYVGNPPRDRGYSVQCPLDSNRKTAVVGGKLRINKDDSIRDRFSCLLCERENNHMCPNRDFEVTFKKLGETEEFEWLTALMKQACKAVDLKLIHSRRYHGDCCLKHRNCTLVRFDTKKLKESAFDPRANGPVIHDMIVKEAEKTSFEAVHVKLEWRGGPYYRFEIALWRLGEDRGVITRQEKTKDEPSAEEPVEENEEFEEGEE